jgi:rod shape-determining protein MreC
VVAIGLVIISFLLMTFDIRSSSQGVAGTLRNGAQTLAGPVQGLLNRVVDPIVDFGDGLANLAGLRQENERLRDRISELEQAVVQIETLRNENTGLRELLDLALPNNMQDIAISAEVTGRGGTLDQAITVDKGTSDGVQVGQPAVNSQGALVGVVAEVSESSSSIVPITSPNAPGVVVQLKDGTRGIVQSSGAGSLVLAVFSEEPTRVLEGDLLTTYGPYETSTQYPRGLLVGRAAQSATPVAGSFEVPVDPIVANIDRVLFVMIIPWPPEDAGSAQDDEPATTDTTEVPPLDGTTEGGADAQP